MHPTSPGQPGADKTSDAAPIGCAFGAPSSTGKPPREIYRLRRAAVASPGALRLRLQTASAPSAAWPPATSR